MRDEPSYYDVLGVTPTSSSDEIETAWKQLIRMHHPDQFTPDERPAANARTAAINEAFQTLSDPIRKARYDQKHTGWARSVSIDSAAALETLVRMRKARRVEMLRAAGAAAAGVAALVYTARALRIGL